MYRFGTWADTMEIGRGREIGHQRDVGVHEFAHIGNEVAIGPNNVVVQAKRRTPSGDEPA